MSINAHQLANRSKGFSILEVVVALSLFILILLTVGSYASFSLANLSSQQAVIQAETLGYEASVIMTAIAKRDWSLFNTNVSSLNYNNNQWSFLGPDTVEQLGIYRRQVNLTTVCRDTAQLVVDCSQGTVDSGTYKTTVVVSWSDWSGDHKVKQESYVSNWR